MRLPRRVGQTLTTQCRRPLGEDQVIMSLLPNGPCPHRPPASTRGQHRHRTFLQGPRSIALLSLDAQPTRARSSWLGELMPNLAKNFRKRYCLGNRATWASSALSRSPPGATVSLRAIPPVASSSRRAPRRTPSLRSCQTSRAKLVTRCGRRHGGAAAATIPPAADVEKMGTSEVRTDPGVTKALSPRCKALQAPRHG